MVTRLAPPDPIELLITTGSLMEGDFLLSSGERSSFYFDSKLLTLDPLGGPFVGEYFIDKLMDHPIKAVGGMAHGAIPIITAIVGLSIAHKKPLPGFYVRQDSKTHGTQKLIEGNFPDDKSAPVVIIDDVVTSGGSIIQAIEAVEARGNPIIKVMCILDRDEGGRQALQERGYELQAMYTVVRDERSQKPNVIFNR